MIVKVCGVTTEAIAEVAVDAGADWIGLVFAPASPRHCDDGTARRLVRAVAGRADVVGVLVAPTAQECDDAAERYGLAAVQVHGAVDRRLVEACATPVIRAVNISTRAQGYTIDWWPDALLHLDATPDELGALPGGTGNRVPLEWAVEVARHRRVVLAGGLDPDNVGEVIERARPAGVDASSGLESAPGVKDPSLVERFVRSARAAFQRAGDERR